MPTRKLQLGHEWKMGISSNTKHGDNRRKQEACSRAKYIGARRLGSRKRRSESFWRYWVRTYEATYSLIPLKAQELNPWFTHQDYKRGGFQEWAIVRWLVFECFAWPLAGPLVHCSSAPRPHGCSVFKASYGVDSLAEQLVSCSQPSKAAQSN